MKKLFFIFPLTLSLILQCEPLQAGQTLGSNSSATQLPQTEDAILKADLTRLAQVGVVAVFFEEKKEAKDFVVRLGVSDSVVEVVSNTHISISLSRLLPKPPATQEVPASRLRFALQDLSRVKVQGVSFEKERAAAHFAALFGFPDSHSVVVSSKVGQFDILSINLLTLQRR